MRTIHFSVPFFIQGRGDLFRILSGRRAHLAVLEPVGKCFDVPRNRLELRKRGSRPDRHIQRMYLSRWARQCSVVADEKVLLIIATRAQRERVAVAKVAYARWRSSRR